METLSFIGSDKNAGKTTVLNFIHDRLVHSNHGSRPVCVTSIGINGESADAYDGKPKPNIRIPKGGMFVTRGVHLNRRTGEYDITGVYERRQKRYIIGECRRGANMVIEGPNTGDEIRELKSMLETVTGVRRLLIDGSIDRRFIARPEISDGFFFALLITPRKPHIRKAEALLSPLTFPAASKEEIESIEQYMTGSNKSILINGKGEGIYQSGVIPAFDGELENACLKSGSEPRLLYLNGALTPKLSRFLAPFRKLTVVLDNFTLYAPSTSGDIPGLRFFPAVKLLNPVSARAVFLKVEDGADFRQIPIPEHTPVYNLFRECPDEIGI